jgi:hypothetical protein
MSDKQIDNKGLVADVYEIKVLPNTATQLVEAIYEQKDLTREDAYDMADYLDKKYGMTDYIKASQYGLTK